MKGYLYNKMSEVLTRWGMENEGHHKVFFSLFLIALLSLFASTIAEAFGRNLSLQVWFANLTQGFSIEIAGTLATFVLVERIIDKEREERQRVENEEREKREKLDLLIYDIIGQSHTQTLRAIDELRNNEWLYDGTLNNKNLRGANLQGATLHRANLHHVYLIEANLSGADLFAVNFDGANLSTANLEHANLDNASLRGTNLRKCNLRHARLSNANFDESTILPDGSHWHPEVELSTFTNPNQA